MKAIRALVLGTIIVASVGVARADECSDRYPGGAPPYSFVQKTRFEVATGVDEHALNAGVSAEKIWHPHVDGGLRLGYARAWESGDQSFDAIAEVRVFPLMVFGGLGTNGVCGMKARLWRGNGAPYLALGIGGWATSSFDDGGVAGSTSLGWDAGFGRRLSLFAQVGRRYYTNRDDSFFFAVGLRF